MSYTNSAFANIKNNTGITLKSVTLHHQYSDDPDEGMTWSNVGAGTTTSSLTVNYNTGFIRTGNDYWWAQYTLPDGSVWVSPGTLTETLHSGDQGTTKTFVITGSILADWRGSTMQLSMDELPNYNSWAVVLLQNNFPVSVSATLSHKYSDDNAYQCNWLTLAPGATTPADQGFIVYFNTGFIRTGSDHWYMTLKLDIPPYDNALASAFQSFSNSNSDKACMLYASDNGLTHTFKVDGSVFTMGIVSGSCTDNWTTWNEYNTLAFLQIKNNFTTAISTVVLTHQYSSDTTWQQTRGLVSAGANSDLMVVEYNTGFLRTGLDYWNVYVYLEDGTWYQNHKTNKECMLSTSDTTATLTFGVSSTTFNLGLISGACSDSMDSKGTFAPAAGRDVNQPYNKNAFIGSHNAYANFGNGFWYAQQSEDLKTQMGQGATTLLLDIWYDVDSNGNGDIYLKHENQGIMQPFVANQKLSTALGIIRDFLTLQSRDPVTIVFEDRVDASHQSLIRQAFVTSNTWDMVFNPDTYDVGKNGWPTLAQFFTPLCKPIIVLTSNSSSTDFAYQWKYMSENVYGDSSLDSTTWLNPRGESQGLDKLDLCALNHFPTWSISSFTLTAWIARAQTDNATALLKTMIDACYTKWNRYPNYINADFWEIPTNGVIDAITYLNQKLHGTTQSMVRMQHGRAILQEQDHGCLLRGNWQRETAWLDQHLGDICKQPATDRNGPLVYELENVVNLTLVVSTLLSVLPEGESVVQPWAQQTVRHVVRYLMDLESQVLAALDTDSAAHDELCAIPYFLLERALGIQFDVTRVVRQRMHGRTVSGDHDRLLLAGLAGECCAVEQLRQKLEKSRTASATEGLRSSKIYDLTHEILYLLRLDALSAPATSFAPGLEGLLGHFMPVNQDLGAELLACYWLTGGPATAASRRAVQCLKAFSDAQPAECRADDCGQCRCPRFKEQIHKRLTMVLGLGVTLSTVGEVLKTHESVVS